MREIKFRAWIKKYKHDGAVPIEMRPDFGFPKMVDVYCLFSENSFEYQEELGYRQVYPARYDFELMQYTGLKDKNGKKIYEGDIIKIPYTYYDRIDFAIKVPYDEYILGVVTYDEKSACFGVVIPEDCDELSKGFNSFDYAFKNIGYECEVIGNKFEDEELAESIMNPELIKENCK